MFRELAELPRRLRAVPAPARPHRRALPAAGRPHRPPLRRPRRTSRRPGAGRPGRPGQRRHPVRRRRRFGLRVVRGADDHGRGPPALPRQQLVGQGAAAAQGAAPAARRGDRGAVAAAGPRTDRRPNWPPNSEMDRDEVVEGLVAGSSYNTLSIDSGGGGDEDAPAIADTLGDVDLSLDQIENREALRPAAGSAARARAHRAGAAVLRVDDADPDRRAGRHLADARVAAAGEVANAAPGPAGVAAAVRPATRSARRRRRLQIGSAESGSQIRSSRLTAVLGTSAQRMSSPTHCTLSVCSAENPAVAKKVNPERSMTSRSVCVGVAQRVVDELVAVGRVELTVNGDDRGRLLRPSGSRTSAVWQSRFSGASSGERLSIGGVGIVTPSVEIRDSDFGSRQGGPLVSKPARTDVRVTMTFPEGCGIQP